MYADLEGFKWLENKVNLNPSICELFQIHFRKTPHQTWDLQIGI